MVRRWQKQETPPAAQTTEASLVACIEEEFKSGCDYQRAMGFPGNWQEYEQMKVGQQWPTVSRRTKHLLTNMSQIY